MIIRKLKKFIHLSLLRSNKLCLFKNYFKTPPIIIFFVTSACNSKCPHCFYKNNLNRKNDLTLGEIEKISQSMRKVYQLELSGGEPFLRKDLPEICELFYKNNHLEELQIPTNSLLADEIYKIVETIFRKCPGIELNLNLSLDGTEKVHDLMRGVKGNFQKVMKNYQNLVILKKTDKNLFINITSIVSKKNIDDLFDLADFVIKNMPLVNHHYLGYERGRFYTDKIDLPQIGKLRSLNEKIEKLYRRKNGLIYTNLIKKINEVKVKTLESQRQVVSCVAGKLVGVIYEDGKIANCEMLPAIGKAREGNFQKVWQSQVRLKQRKEIIEKKVCYCTHECFISPSVAYGLPGRGYIRD